MRPRTRWGARAGTACPRSREVVDGIPGTRISAPGPISRSSFDYGAGRPIIPFVMPPGEIERIGELLVEEGIVTQEELTRALTESGAKSGVIGQLLEACAHVRRAELAAFLASKFRLPVIDDLRRVDLTPDASRLVPEEIARKHEVIPICRIGDLLCVAKANYYNRAAVQELRKVSGLKIKVLQADEGQVRAAIEAVYKGRKGDLPAPVA